MAETPELLEASKGALAALIAAQSIIRRAEDMGMKPSQVVASKTIFAMMMKDYDNAAAACRAAILEATGGK